MPRLPDPSSQPFSNLREFTWYNNDDEVALQPAEVQYIASMTALQSLKIGYFHTWCDVTAFQELPLQSLSLYCCNHMELDLIKPKALCSLTELSITDEIFANGPHVPVKYDAAHPSLQHRFEEVSDAVLSLPKLCRLVGESVTNSLVMKKVSHDCKFSYCRVALESIKLAY